MMGDLQGASWPGLESPLLLRWLRANGFAKEIVVESCVSRAHLVEAARKAVVSEVPDRRRLHALLADTRVDGTFSTTYVEKRDCGRQYPANYSKACASIMARPVRKFLYGGHWIDVDIVACHHAMLLNVARAIRVPAPKLEEYIARRAHWLKKVAAAFSIGEPQAKAIFIKYVYGSRMAHVHGSDGKNRSVLTPMSAAHAPSGVAPDEAEATRAFLGAFKAEMDAICAAVVNHAGMISAFSKVWRAVLRDGESWNQDSKRVCCVLEVCERMALEALAAAAKPDFVAGDRIFDGMLMRSVGNGAPREWIDSGAAAAMCERASGLARDVYGLIGVTFKPSVLDGSDAGRILRVDPPPGLSCPVHAIRALDAVWYVASRSGTDDALMTAVQHMQTFGAKFLVRRDCGVGGWYYAAVADLGSLTRVDGAALPLAEVVSSGPVRAFVRVRCDAVHAAAVMEAFKLALRRYVVGGDGASLVATIEDEPCTLTIIAPGLAVTSAAHAAVLARAAVRGCPDLRVDAVETASTLPLLGERRRRRSVVNAPGHGAGRSVAPEDAALTPSTATPVLQLTSEGEALLHTEATAPASPGVPLFDVGRGDLEEEVLGVLLALEPPPLDDDAGLDTHVYVAAAMCAQALTSVRAGNINAERDAKRRFKDWATASGSIQHTKLAFLPNTLWDKGRNKVDDWRGTDNQAERASLIRHALDGVRERWPQVYRMYVEAVAAQLTGRVWASTEGDAAAPIRRMKATPGPMAIPNNALFDTLRGAKYLAMSAPAGFGKTCALKRALAKLFESGELTNTSSCARSCLWVTTRVSVADDIERRLNDGSPPLPEFRHYKLHANDVERIGDIEYLVCELESLGRLRQSETYDVVVLDEFSTILVQTMSPINMGRYTILCDRLKSLCSSARRVLLADALLNEHGVTSFVEAAESRAGPTAPTRNKVGVMVCTLESDAVPPWVRIVSQSHKHSCEDYERAFQEEVAKCVESVCPPRFFVFTNIKKEVPHIKEAFEKAVGPHISQPKVLVLTAETMMTKKGRPTQGETVTEWWMGYDMVIATPAVTNSLSFDADNHFASTLAFVSNMSCVAPDTFQGMLRVRRPTLNRRMAYVSSTNLNNNAQSVKSYKELDNLAREMHANASPMERLCYRAAKRQSLFSFHFYGLYLAACFSANGFTVEEVAAPRVSGKRKRDDEARKRVENMAEVAWHSIPQVHATAYDGHLKPNVKPALHGVLDEDDARAALEMVHASPPESVALSQCEWLCMVTWRHKMDHMLLDPSKELLEEDAAARAKTFSMFVQQMARGVKGNCCLWSVRQAMDYEALARCGTAQKLEERFPNNLSTGWNRKHEIIQRALRAIGLQSAFPSSSNAKVQRQTLAPAMHALTRYAMEARKVWGKSEGRERAKPSRIRLV